MAQNFCLMTDAEFRSYRSEHNEDASERVMVVEATGVELWEFALPGADALIDHGPEGGEAPASNIEQTDGWQLISRFSLASEPPARARRGDATALVEMGGKPMVAIDHQGMVIARLSPDALLASLQLLANAPNTDLGKTLGLSAPVNLRRGDSAAVAELGGMPTIAVRGDGTVAARLDPASIEHVASHMNVPGGRPEGPDCLQAYDAWNVRRDRNLLYFTANLWGNHPRDYVRRGRADPWAVSVREVQLRLICGDEFSDAPVSASVDHFAHILVFDDGEGVEGLGGEPPATEAVAEDIDRVGPCFASVAADTALRHKKGAKPWIGIRSEAIPGATVSDLAEGPGLDNLEHAVHQFRAAVSPYGKVAATQVVTVMHGNSDTGTDYKQQLLRLCRRIVERTGARQINLFQPVGTAFEHDLPSVLATVEVFRERGDLPLVLVSPIYPAARRPGSMLQPSAEAMTMLAELDGLADRNWLPPLAFAARRDGPVILVDFEVMEGHSLVAPSYGLRYVADDGQMIEVTGAKVVPDRYTKRPTTLEITLSEQPETAGMLSYAYGNLDESLDLSGSQYHSGGDIRDDWSHPSVTGATLHRYAFAFQFRV